MSDRQVKAVEGALASYINEGWRQQAAEQAIAASDARFVPALVEILRRVAATYEASLIEYEGHGAANFDPVLQDVRLVIKGLPKEYRK